MKSTKWIFLLLILMLAGRTPAWTDTFPVSVTIPAANSATFTVSKVINNQFQATGNNNLSFTTTFDAENNTFLGDFFYAIDVAPGGGAGGVDIDIDYADTSVNTGLGTHAIGTVVKATSNPADGEQLLKREILDDLNNVTIFGNQVTGGFMRMYVGLATGDPDASPAEPASAVPFNTGDAPGLYSGTLTLTAVQP